MKYLSKQEQETESSRLKEADHKILENRFCQRCNYTGIFVDFSKEWKQTLCPWCLHWLELSESMKKVIIDPKDVKIITDGKQLT